MSSRFPQNADALVLATAFPHGTPAQQDRILFDIAARRFAEALMPSIQRAVRQFVAKGNKLLSDDAVMAQVLGLLRPFLVNRLGEEDTNKILGMYREMSTEAAAPPETGCAECKSASDIIESVSNWIDEGGLYAVREFVLTASVDESTVRVDDLGGDAMRLTATLRHPSGPTVVAHVNVTKPASVHGRSGGLLGARVCGPVLHVTQSIGRPFPVEVERVPLDPEPAPVTAAEPAPVTAPAPTSP